MAYTHSCTPEQPTSVRTQATSLGSRAKLLLLFMVLLYAASFCHAQYVGTAAGTPASGPINNGVAGHWFQQRGNGTANVAVNYDFVNNTFQDAPGLRVHGKPFSLAFWYRTTQTGQHKLLWENGEVGSGSGYVVGLNDGFISIAELDQLSSCSFTDWLHGSTATNDGKWHHAAFVADRDNAAGADTAHTYAYKDGVLDGTLPYCDPADNTSSSGNQWYGIGRNSPDFDFAGDVEHFTAWVGVAMTADEVKYHMNGGLPHYSNAGVWYEFENADGQRVPDLGPNHYDGHVSPDASPLLGPGPAFQAYVVDPDGVPIPLLEVVFTAPATGQSGTFINGLKTVRVTTDFNGIATAPLFTANGIPGSYTVTAKIQGVTAPARFSVTNRVSISASAGTPQSTAVQTPFTYPLQVAVTDTNLNPMPNLTVTFKAPTTGAFATFPGGLATVTAVTTASGLATSPVLTANNVAGAFTVNATVTGVSAPFSLTNTTATATALSSSVNPSAYNQSVALTVNVTTPATNLPSGTALITDTTLGTTLANVTVTKGVGSYKTGAMAVGSHVLQASFTDGAGFLPSLSPTLTQTVSQASPTVSLKSSLATSVFQQSVTITATVASQFGGTTTGTVTFLDGSTVVAGPVALASGKAAFSTSKLAVGSHSITAVYSGDANIAGSTSPAFVQTVNQAPSKVTLAASPNPAAVGRSVTLTATVVGVPSGAVLPTGTVTFTLPNSTILGSVALTAGKGKLTTSALPAGSNVITATYGGDANFTGNAGTVTEVVQ